MSFSDHTIFEFAAFPRSENPFDLTTYTPSPRERPTPAHVLPNLGGISISCLCTHRLYVSASRSSASLPRIPLNFRARSPQSLVPWSVEPTGQLNAVVLEDEHRGTTSRDGADSLLHFNLSFSFSCIILFVRTDDGCEARPWKVIIMPTPFHALPPSTPIAPDAASLSVARSNLRYHCPPLVLSPNTTTITPCSAKDRRGRRTVNRQQ